MLKAVLKKEFALVVIVGGALGFLIGNRLFSVEEKASVVSALPGAEEQHTLESVTTRVKVARVVDGDTIELETGERVRYIGIDAPEGAWPGKEPECYAVEATEANRKLVEGKDVDVETDVSDTDKFGRLLRYVYRDGALVNRELVRQGAAFAVSYEPDTKYGAVLKAAELEAIHSGEGAWGACGYFEGNKPRPD